MAAAHALKMAVATNDAQAFYRCVEEHTTTENTATGLMEIASLCGHLSMVKLIIERYHEYDPVRIAQTCLREGHLHIVEWLVDENHLSTEQQEDLFYYRDG